MRYGWRRQGAWEYIVIVGSFDVENAKVIEVQPWTGVRVMILEDAGLRTLFSRKAIHNPTDRVRRVTITPRLEDKK